MKRWIHAVTVNYEFVELPQFTRQAKKLGLTSLDINELKQALIDEEPEASLGSNVYKFRWVPNRWNMGQSKATRVIYVDVIKDSKAYLVTIYSKKQKATLDPDEEKAVKKLGKLLSKGGNR